MRSLVASLTGVLLLTSSTVLAAAQPPRRPPPAPRPARQPRHRLLRISIDAGGQVVSPTLDQTLNFQQYVEKGTLTLERPLSKSAFVDGGMAVQVTRKFFAGAAVAFFHDSGPGRVTASVPHPFFFNQPREVSGTIEDVTRTDFAVHLQGAWTTPVSRKMELTVFGGPSIFQTAQVLATGLNLSLADEVYPYDSLAFPTVNSARVSGHVFGYNAGADVTWRLKTWAPKQPRALTKALGVAVLVRYSHGSKDFEPVKGSPAAITVGGLHIGGGLRVNF